MVTDTCSTSFALRERCVRIQLSIDTTTKEGIGVSSVGVVIGGGTRRTRTRTRRTRKERTQDPVRIGFFPLFTCPSCSSSSSYSYWYCYSYSPRFCDRGIDIQWIWTHLFRRLTFLLHVSVTSISIGTTAMIDGRTIISYCVFRSVRILIYGSSFRCFGSIRSVYFVRYLYVFVFMFYAW